MKKLLSSPKMTIKKGNVNQNKVPDQWHQVIIELFVK